MTDNNKTGKNSQNDFIRYRRNEMSDSERNSFERELQKDQFAEEADEGFASMTPEEASEDIANLQKLIKNRVKPARRFVYYRIAASVAVLMVISTIFIVTQRNSTAPVLADNINTERKNEVAEPEAGQKLKQTEEIPDRKEIASSDSQSTPAASKRTKSPAAPLKETEKEPEMNDIDIEEEKLVAGVEIAEAAKENEDISIAAEKKMDMSRAAGAQARFKSVAARDYEPPQPIVGKDSFDIYVERNLRNPGPDSAEQEYVILTFSVGLDSTVNKIKIINTPGRDYSNEATRLLKEGPLWIPAKENGMAVVDEVTFRFVFK